MSISSEDIHSDSSEAKKIRTSERIKNINLEKIKILFETQDVLSLKLSDTRDIKEDPLPSYDSFIMSPFSKRIYDSLTTEEKPRFKRDLYLDNVKISIIENKFLDEIYNPDYKLYDYLEYFISYFFRCPVCRNKTLRKYANISMPIIDIVCINNDHPENKTRYFQIKTTNGALHFGEPYFSKSERFINIGSYKYGYNVHNITNTTEEQYRNMLIGYICIEYIYNEMSENITINYNNSFYLIPELLDIPFYNYITRNKISFIGEPKDIRDIYDNITIPKYYFFTPKIKPNPLNLPSKQLLFDENKYYKLYIKYKIKYLRLKNINVFNEYN
jgi:hypothetical protein